jgi:hypothetical protein
MRRGWAAERERLFAAEGAGAIAAHGPGAVAAHGVGAVATAAAAPRGRVELVGRDFADPPRRVRSRAGLRLPIALGMIVAALLLVTLRVHILRVRYALAEVASREEALLEEKRRMTVRVRELRDPTRLHRLAAERGFGRPDRVLSLALPAPPARPGGAP